MAIEIVDLPINSMVIFQLCDSLPEGKKKKYGGKWMERGFGYQLITVGFQFLILDWDSWLIEIESIRKSIKLYVNESRRGRD